MSASVRASTLERPAPGYESLVHLTVNTRALEHLLTTMDFCSGTAYCVYICMCVCVCVCVCVYISISVCVLLPGPPGEEEGFVREVGAEDAVDWELGIRNL